MQKNVKKKGHKWLKILCFSLVGATLSASIATLVTINAPTSTVVANNSVKTSNTVLNSSTKLEQMNSVINDFTKKANINTNSEEFKVTFATEIEKMTSSKKYITSLLKHDVTDSQYNQLCSLLKNLKDEYAKNAVTNSKKEVTDIKLDRVSQISTNLFSLSTYQTGFISYQNKAIQIINDAISDLNSLSSNLALQSSILSGIGATVSTFLGILSFFDFGTTVAIAIAVGCAFSFICTGIGGIIKTINGSVAKLQSSISQDQISLDVSSTLQQTNIAINSCINSLANAKSKLQNDEWIVGMSNAVSQLDSSINALESISTSIQNSINQLN